MRNYLRFLDAPQRFHDFLDEFQAETDRAAAVLGAAYLDEALEDLFRARFAEAFDADELLGVMRPIGSFSAKILAAEGFGLITAAERRDLDRVRQIRNRFAHRVRDLGFDLPEIADRCRDFECNEERFEALPDLRHHHPADPRSLFDLAVALLAFYLDRRAEYGEPSASADPPLWQFGNEERTEPPIAVRRDNDS